MNSARRLTWHGGPGIEDAFKVVDQSRWPRHPMRRSTL